MASRRNCLHDGYGVHCRLREELTSLQSISQQRGRAGTSDTGRMSTDSIGSQKFRLFEENVVAFTFDTHPSMDLLLE